MLLENTSVNKSSPSARSAGSGSVLSQAPGPRVPFPGIESEAKGSPCVHAWCMDVQAVDHASIEQSALENMQTSVAAPLALNLVILCSLYPNVILFTWIGFSPKTKYQCITIIKINREHFVINKVKQMLPCFM